jgi:hypothetical protein
MIEAIWIVMVWLGAEACSLYALRLIVLDRRRKGVGRSWPVHVSGEYHACWCLNGRAFHNAHKDEVAPAAIMVAMAFPVFWPARLILGRLARWINQAINPIVEKVNKSEREPEPIDLDTPPSRVTVEDIIH